jgi:hypothetical protein
MPKYLIFEPRPKFLIMTGFALLSAGLAVTRIGSSVSVPAFHGTRLAAYPYVMEAITFVVLGYWIASAKDRVKKTFIALWLCAWAVTWFEPVYPQPLLLLAQCATALLWILALVAALRIIASVHDSKHNQIERNDMSRKELVSLVSRAFALLLTTWALVEFTYLPDRVFALSHHLRQGSVLATSSDYWSSYYQILTVFTVARMLAFFFAAILFWRCGPRVEALFSPPPDNQEASVQERAGNC